MNEMNEMKTISFFFSQAISQERLEWVHTLAKVLIGRGCVVNFFMTGDALFAVIDKRNSARLEDLQSSQKCRFMLDKQEADMLGLDVDAQSEFWSKLITGMKPGKKQETAGYLELHGPYMSRTTVHGTRFLKQAAAMGLSPELYLYLDGVHVAHDSQNPSEFENIGRMVQSLFDASANQGKQPKVIACTRCATARGYASPAFDDDHLKSDHGIQACDFLNLNRIVEGVKREHLLLAPNMFTNLHGDNGITRGKSDSEYQDPKLVIFITHPPYGNEYAFGGISLGVAAASNHDVDTSIVFIEDGVFCLSSDHTMQEGSKLINLQEIMVATEDISQLSYHAYKPSLDARGLKTHSTLPFINRIPAIDSQGGLIDLFCHSREGLRFRTIMF